MVHNIFDNTLQKTNSILKDIEQHLEWLQTHHQSFSLLRAVLQTLRDRLTVDEAAHFAAQLPILLRGTFYEGWKPAKVPIKFSKEEFIGEVERKFASDPEVSTEKMIRVVFQVLDKHMSEGEVQQVKDILPRSFREFFP